MDDITQAMQETLDIMDRNFIKKKRMDLEKTLEKYINEVAENHERILSDFTKAYIAERFKGESFKVSDLKLVQVYQGHRTVWFFEPLTTTDGQSVEQIRRIAKREGIQEVIDLIYDDLEGDCSFVRDKLEQKYSL